MVKQESWWQRAYTTRTINLEQVLKFLEIKWIYGSIRQDLRIEC